MRTGWQTVEDDDVVRHARVIPLDVVQAKGAGHAGTAASLTPALYLLFQEVLRHDPSDPAWPGRDRFVLSCGHASLALYLQLWLSGYGLELDDLRKARTLDSLTPGHPEFGHTPGVETTTGPLGQGIGNAVGMAMESARLRHVLGTDLYSYRVWCFASDGDLEEGISHEASSLAGTLQLRDLVVVWDDNSISIEGDTSVTFTESVTERYRSYGWHVLDIPDAEDIGNIREVFTQATTLHDRPVFIRLRSRIGHPMPTVGGTARAHSGAPGADEVRATKVALGLDEQQQFAMPPQLLTHARRVRERGAHEHAQWEQRSQQWQQEHQEAAAELKRMRARDIQPALPALEQMRERPQAVATRVASQAALNAVAPVLPELWGGSADLADSNGTNLAGAESYLPPGFDIPEQWSGLPGGQLVHFGVREHAMGAILNGMALGGVSRPFGATFFVFSDYMRPAVRLAALMGLPVTYVWSHDSVAVGEDGPTHQPLEHLWSYRAIVGLSVARPADWVETADVWRRILSDSNGPTALVLSRQSLPIVAGHTSYDSGAARGAYTIWGEASSPAAIIIATGSEVCIAISAAETLRDAGIEVRVVSAPCLEWFEQEDPAYRQQILPDAVTHRVSVEAGTDLGWYKWIGASGRTVSATHYGTSGAGDVLLERQGITADAVVAAVQGMLGRQLDPAAERSDQTGSD